MASIAISYGEGGSVFCGLKSDGSHLSHQPYCCGNNGFIQMEVPHPMINGAEYLELSAGDYHLCGLRKPLMRRQESSKSGPSSSHVDCWGYNITRTFVFDKQIHPLSAGSEFNYGCPMTKE
ncbi:hypothetical protein Bca4012_005640 [Brassica carinata]